MNKISTDKINPVEKLFHNERIQIYPTYLPLEEIVFWKENNRTIFTFQRLERKIGKSFKDISVEEITQFIAEQDIHKLQLLSDSIERNGVQIPLILLDDGTLLDGNRRYFASYWLKMKYEKLGKVRPKCLSEIPVLIIRKEDISHSTELKILAEANFIQDLKLPWSLDAQARAVEDFYITTRSKNKDHESSVLEIIGTFGITKQRTNDLLDSLALTYEFIDEGISEQDKINRRIIVEEKFIYFWEFRNKAMRGKGKYSDVAELKEVKGMFFNLMAMGKDTPIKNVKQIEPLAQARRNKTAWAMLNESKGAKLSVAVAVVNEKKEARKAEDKIRIFQSWLEDADDLTPGVLNSLEKLIETIQEKLQG